MSSETKIKTFKAFNKDWTCRDFQYKIGETYVHEGEIKACESGFHSCQYPLDIFNYYNPCSSVFAEVECSGKVSKEDSDSKVASERIILKRELSVSELIAAAIEYTTSNCVDGLSNYMTGYQAASSATGDQAASSATGDQAASSATGYQAASSATGYRAASLVTGAYSTAETINETNAPLYATAISTGHGGKVRGTIGDALFLVERHYEGEIIAVWSGIVGKKRIKPNTWYTLIDGKPTIVEKNDE